VVSWDVPDIIDRVMNGTTRGFLYHLGTSWDVQETVDTVGRSVAVLDMYSL
jgi:hypothetical protein